MYTSLTSALFVLPFLFTTILGAPQAATESVANFGSCVMDSEVNYISQRWLNAFRSNNPVPIADAATANIVIYDGGANNGTTDTPYVSNRDQLAASIAAGPYGGGGVKDVTYNVVFTFHTCNRIALRWQQNVVTTDNIGYGSTVKAGTKISFQGTDLLTIDLRSKKVSGATTSADLLAYYDKLGYNLGVFSGCCH